MSGCWSRPAAAGDPVVSDRVIVLSDSTLSGGPADTLDMGRIRAGDEVLWQVSLRNDSPEPVIITAVVSSCGCATVDYPKQPIRPGEALPFTIRLKSAGYYGLQYKTVTLRMSRNNGVRRIVVKAEIYPG